MSRFNLKSLVLGIGIGIIITAVAGMIFAAGRDPMEGVSKEQIMAQAEKYGMIRSSILQESISGAQAETSQTGLTAAGAQTGLVQGSVSSK